MESVCGSTLLQSFASVGNRAGVALLLQYGSVLQQQCKEMINVLFRVDPAATTAKNTKLPERWAYENNHVGALAELTKVKEVEPDIMDSSLGKLVLKDEEREWRRQMLEQLTEQNQLIALLAKKTLGAEQVEDNDDSEAKC